MDHTESPDELTEKPEIEDIEIIELLGKGGMSLVYKARQEQLDRIVAVKVLSKLAVRGEGGIKRFHKEAKLTSTLEHPNIVKTISFGISKDRQPYLVMEYLEGLSLADDLKQNGRLKLLKFKDVFLPILSALGHAHQTGMIHRDIKPGNIMICRSDSGAETVKLVDFGIAKVFGEGESETQNLTKSGAVLGSPTYMSPEQCQGKPLDGRSDLYSLACVMYETLSGEPPFSGDSLLEVMQKHSAEPPPTVSDLSRKIDISKELAKVTLWGLAKDPAARPQTASEFARKLNEVLERMTLDKIPRLKKPETLFSRRLALQPLSIILVCCALLFCGVVFMLTRHQTQVQIPRMPPVALKEETFRKDEREYKRTLLRAEKAFGTDNQKIIRVLHDMANWYKRQDKYLEAEPLLKRALAIREKELGADNPLIADSLNALMDCYFHQAKYTQAEPLLKRALAIREKELGLNDPSIVDSLGALWNCYIHQDKYAEAEPLLKRALTIKEKALGPNNSAVADSLSCLADCCEHQGKYAEAEHLLKRSLAIREKAPGPNKPALADSLYLLAYCYSLQGRYAEAEPLLKRSLAIREKAPGPNKPTVADSLYLLAYCYSLQGRYAEAEPLLKRSLAIREKALGPNKPTVADSLYLLAYCYSLQGRYAEAESLLERTLVIREKAFEPNAPAVADSLSSLAECYRSQGKYEVAEALSKRVMAIRKTKLGPSLGNSATNPSTAR